MKSTTDGIEELKLIVKEIDRENKRLQHGYRELVDINERLQSEMQNLNSCRCSEKHSSDTLTSFKRLLLNNGKTVTVFKTRKNFRCYINVDQIDKLCNMTITCQVV